MAVKFTEKRECIFREKESILHISRNNLSASVMAKFALLI
jgi:hypothetical protein